MKYSILAILILFISCTKKNESEKVVKTIKVETPIKMTDKSVKFLWREDAYDKELKDTVNTIFINQEYCKNISDPEKAGHLDLFQVLLEVNVTGTVKQTKIMII